MVVITHPQWGIYIGSCMGLGFWTLMDSVGQDAVVCFNDEQEARGVVTRWEENNNPDEYGYVTVEADIEDATGLYASVDVLEDVPVLAELMGDIGMVY